MVETCGAKTRAGGSCAQKAMANGRCLYHGGKSTGPKNPNSAKNAIKHGIYYKHLSEDEQAGYDDLEIGHVDHELKLARIRLARALAAEATANGAAETLEEIENQGGGPNVAVSSKRKVVRDYSQIIDRLTARVESLERTRKLLDTASDGENEKIAGFETVPYDDDE